MRMDQRPAHRHYVRKAEAWTFAQAERLGVEYDAIRYAITCRMFPEMIERLPDRAAFDAAMVGRSPKSAWSKRELRRYVSFIDYRPPFQRAA